MKLLLILASLLAATLQVNAEPLPPRVQSSKDIAALQAIFLYDKEPCFSALIKQDSKYRMYENPAMRQSYSCIGRDLAEALENGGCIPKGSSEHPELLTRSLIEHMTDADKRKKWQKEYDNIKAEVGYAPKMYYALLANIEKEKVLEWYNRKCVPEMEAVKAEIAASGKDVDEVRREIDAKYEREIKERQARADREARERKEREYIEQRRIRRTIWTILYTIGGLIAAYALYRLLKYLAARYPEQTKGYLQTLCRIPHPATIAACIILIIACIDEMSRSYHTFLRVTICAYAIFVAIHYYKKNTLNLRTYLAASIAILFNPAFPIDPYYQENWLTLCISSALLLYLFLPLPLPTKTPPHDS